MFVHEADAEQIERPKDQPAMCGTPLAVYPFVATPEGRRAANLNREAT